MPTCLSLRREARKMYKDGGADVAKQEIFDSIRQP